MKQKLDGKSSSPVSPQTSTLPAGDQPVTEMVRLDKSSGKLHVYHLSLFSVVVLES